LTPHCRSAATILPASTAIQDLNYVCIYLNYRSVFFDDRIKTEKITAYKLIALNWKLLGAYLRKSRVFESPLNYFKSEHMPAKSRETETQAKSGKTELLALTSEANHSTQLASERPVPVDPDMKSSGSLANEPLAISKSSLQYT
jgi:hypothetical protein